MTGQLLDEPPNCHLQTKIEWSTRNLEIIDFIALHIIWSFVVAICRPSKRIRQNPPSENLWSSVQQTGSWALLRWWEGAVSRLVKCCSSSIIKLYLVLYSPPLCVSRCMWPPTAAEFVESWKLRMKIKINCSFDDRWQRVSGLWFGLWAPRYLVKYIIILLPFLFFDNTSKICCVNFLQSWPIDGLNFEMSTKPHFKT